MNVQLNILNEITHVSLKKWESHKLPERKHFSDQDSEDECEEYISDKEIVIPERKPKSKPQPKLQRKRKSKPKPKSVKKKRNCKFPKSSPGSRGRMYRSQGERGVELEREEAISNSIQKLATLYFVSEQV